MISSDTVHETRKSTSKEKATAGVEAVTANTTAELDAFDSTCENTT